ncbi:MAG: helix-turn-helix transcriptional regulator, partial [Flavipsychrobacter sp.]
LTLAKAKQNLATQKYNMKVREAESQRSFNVLLRDALIVGILLLAVIALLVINRQKIRHNQNLQKLEVEKWKAEVDKRRAESELVTAEHRLADFTRSLKEKNELIEQFASEIERYKTISSEQDRVSQQDALLQLQRSTILTDDQWEDFRNLFEQVHSGYLNRLREKLPLLTPAETRFITLSKLKLSNKEMAGVLGISNDAVRMSKHRLRKKLNLTTDEELEQVIETI